MNKGGDIKTLCVLRMASYTLNSKRMWKGWCSAWWLGLLQVSEYVLGSQQEFPAGETETLELPFAHLHHMEGRKPKALKRDFFFFFSFYQDCIGHWCSKQLKILGRLNELSLLICVFI